MDGILEGNKQSTIAAMAASRYNPKVGDKIRTRKGGQIPGTITKVEGSKVHFTHPEGKKYHTHIDNVVKEEVEIPVEEAFKPSAEFLARAAAKREMLSSKTRKNLEKRTGSKSSAPISAAQAKTTAKVAKKEEPKSTGTSSTSSGGKVDRIAAIKNAAEKLRLRKAAASNRSAFGGQLGGGFSLPGSGWRRYSEEAEKSSKSQITADASDKTTEKRYLGKSRGRTVTGSAVDIVNTKPNIKMK